MKRERMVIVAGYVEGETYGLLGPQDTRPVFGLLVRRNLGRDDSEIAWPRVDASRAYVSWIAQGGDLTGLNGIGKSSGLEFSPYVVTTNDTRPSGNGWTHPTTQKVGGDLRYGITPNVSLNATIHPDFGQVEADPAELNLTAYELFYPERRPFFTEGSSVFDVRVWCDGVLAQECTSPVYSRRIGRAPQLASRYGDAGSPLACVAPAMAGCGTNRPAGAAPTSAERP